MCNQIGKSTENILMRWRWEQSTDADVNSSAVEWQRTHIKTSDVLCIHTHTQSNKNNIKLNSIRSKYILSKRVLKIYDGLDNDGQKVSERERGRKTVHVYSEHVLFYSFECLQSHIYFILFFFLFPRIESCFMPKFCCSVFAAAAVGAVHLFGTWRKQPAAVRLVGWCCCHWFFLFVYNPMEHWAHVCFVEGKKIWRQRNLERRWMTKEWRERRDRGGKIGWAK